MSRVRRTSFWSREVASEAGSANNSAVHYHFGSKDALIAAIFEHRLPQIVRERRLLATRDAPHDLRSRLEAHYLPVFTLAEAADNHYVSFVEQLQRAEPASVRHLIQLPEEGQRSNDEFRTDLDDSGCSENSTLRREDCSSLNFAPQL
jgi:AcrR family transcriptional regulator